jgi:hypothetical protein
MPISPYLCCKNSDCHYHRNAVPIRLPYPNLPDTTEGPPSWPTASWRINFACPSCGHVSPYTAQDVQWTTVSTSAPGEPQTHRKDYVEIQFVCGESDCRTPVKFHTQVRAGTTTLELVGLLAQGTYQGHCRRNHYFHFVTVASQRLGIVQQTIPSD